MVIIINCSDQAPGLAECQRALLNVRRLLHEMERDKMAMMNDTFAPRHDSTEEGFLKVCLVFLKNKYTRSIYSSDFFLVYQQLSMSARAVRDLAPQIGRGASSEIELLGRGVRELDLLLPGLVSSSLGAASRAPNSSTQLTYLEHTRTVLESVEQLLSAAKQASGNPRVSSY